MIFVGIMCDRGFPGFRGSGAVDRTLSVHPRLFIRPDDCGRRFAGEKGPSVGDVLPMSHFVHGDPICILFKIVILRFSDTKIMNIAIRYISHHQFIPQRRDINLEVLYLIVKGQP